MISRVAPIVGNVSETIRHIRRLKNKIDSVKSVNKSKLYSFARELKVPYNLLSETARLGHLPTVIFASGGIETPADVSLVLQLGVNGIFLDSEIFKSTNCKQRVSALVQAFNHYNNPKKLAEICEDWSEAMDYIDRVFIAREYISIPSCHDISCLNRTHKPTPVSPVMSKEKYC